MANFHILRKVSCLPSRFGRYGQLAVTQSCVTTQCNGQSASFSSFESNSTSVLVKNTFNQSLTQSPLMSAFSINQSRAASTGDHVRLWQIERLVSASVIGLLPACIILENPIIDSVTALLIIMHSHWGLDAVILDYARPSVVGPIIPKIAHLLLNLLSAVTLAGLLVLIYNGPGLGKTIKNVWSIGKEEN